MFRKHETDSCHISAGFLVYCTSSALRPSALEINLIEVESSCSEQAVLWSSQPYDIH